MSGYVKTEEDSALWDVLAAPWWEKALMAAATVAALAAAGAALWVPFPPEVLARFRWLVHVRWVLGAVLVWWFFFRLLPPPFAAKQSHRRTFLKFLRHEGIRARGLLREHVLACAIAEDRDTLVLTVSGEWLRQPADKRLRDAQELWRLWSLAYLPHDGSDKCLLRLVDPAGREVGGSQPGTGSLIRVSP